MGGMMLTKSLSMKSAPLGAMSSSFMKEEKMLSAGGFDDMMDSCEEADDDEADGMMMMGMMEAEACAAPPKCGGAPACSTQGGQCERGARLARLDGRQGGQDGRGEGAEARPRPARDGDGRHLQHRGGGRPVGGGRQGGGGGHGAALRVVRLEGQPRRHGR